MVASGSPASFEATGQRISAGSASPALAPPANGRSRVRGPPGMRPTRTDFERRGCPRARSRRRHTAGALPLTDGAVALPHRSLAVRAVEPRAVAQILGYPVRGLGLLRQFAVEPLHGPPPWGSSYSIIPCCPSWLVTSPGRDGGATRSHTPPFGCAVHAKDGDSASGSPNRAVKNVAPVPRALFGAHVTDLTFSYVSI